jgi:ABC-type antimicrobial peptide transport system permease subunit
MSGGGPVFELNTLAAQVEASLAQERTIATLCGSFGTLALLIISIALYGIITYSVERRINEIGVRVAVGASSLDIMWMILRESMAISSTGLAIGFVISIFVTRLSSSLLFGIYPNDPVTIGASGVIMVAVALTAGCIPAGRASRVDPMSALRYQ